MVINPNAWVLVFHLAGMTLWLGGLWMALIAAAAGNAALANRGLRGLAHPGAALVVLTGALLFYLNPALRMAAWLHVKLLLVVVLIVLDLLLTARVRRMSAQPPTRLALLNGLISAVFLCILALVLVKPF